MSVRSTGDETTRDKSDVAVAHACNAAPPTGVNAPDAPKRSFSKTMPKAWPVKIDRGRAPGSECYQTDRPTESGSLANRLRQVGTGG